MLAILFHRELSMPDTVTKSNYLIQSLSRKTSLLEHVGNTPLIKLDQIAPDLPDSVEFYAKAEWFNPSGSVKDRPAAEILKQALSNGSLAEKKVLLDSTSGNMGIAYATFSTVMGISLHITLPANASRARISILRSLGAELTLTDPLEGSEGAQLVASEISQMHPDRYYYADQYSNPANWQAHFKTTGPEILQQTEARLTHFVAGLGTSGTMMGVGRFLREHLPNVKLIAVQPEGPMHGLEGLKALDTRPHPKIYDPSLPDETLKVSTEEAYAMARKLAHQEGLFVGVSAAAAACGAASLASRLSAGVIVVIFPDSGVKYLDQPFWSES
jgi:cysteine synthase B